MLEGWLQSMQTLLLGKLNGHYNHQPRTQCNRWPFKSRVFCSVHWTLNSGLKWLSDLSTLNSHHALTVIDIQHKWLVWKCKWWTGDKNVYILTFYMTYLQAHKMHAKWKVMALHTVAVKMVNMVPRFFNVNCLLNFCCTRCSRLNTALKKMS